VDNYFIAGSEAFGAYNTHTCDTV